MKALARFWCPASLLSSLFVGIARANTASYLAYSQSVSLKPAYSSLGDTIYFSTPNGNSTPFYDVNQFGQVVAGDELRPRAGQPGIYETGYGAAYGNSFIEDGIVALSFSTTDRDGNGFPDFAQYDQPVYLVGSGTIYSFQPRPYSAPFSVTLSRAAGNVVGSYTASAQLPTGTAYYNGEFDVGASYGNVTYDRSSQTISIAGIITSSPGSFQNGQGSGSYTVQGGNVVLAPMLIITQSGTYQANQTTLSRVSGTTKFRGNLTLQDGNLYTSWPDYTAWMLEINDPNDLDHNGIPDIIDAPLVPPSITQPPMGTNIVQGSTLLLSVKATGSGTLTYQWNFKGQPITGATNGTFTLQNIQQSSGGTYTVTVKGAVGSVTSQPALVAVSAPPPSGLSLTGVIKAGQFQIQAYGTNGVAYEVDVSTNASHWLAWTNFTMTISPTPFSIPVTARAGFVRMILAPVLGNAPVIVQPPISVWVHAGGPVILSVIASGTPPLYYQWTHNGNAIPTGIGPSLNIPIAHSVDAGTYRVTVSNQYGQVTSDPVLLIIR